MFVRNPFVNDTRVIKEGRKLIEAGHTVEVIALYKKGLKNFEIRNDNIIVKRIPKPKKIAVKEHNNWELCRKLGLLLPSNITEIIYNYRNYFLIINTIFVLPILILFSVISFLLSTIKFIPKLLKNILLNLFSKTQNSNSNRNGILQLFLDFKFYFLSIFPSSSLTQHFIREGVKTNPDILHAHDLNTLLPAVIVKKRTNAKLIYDSHELFVNRNSKESVFQKMIWNWLEAQLISNADDVITVSDSIASTLSHRYKIKKPVVIRNVQEFKEFRKNVKLRSIREIKDFVKNKSIAIYAGRITTGRGLEKLIEATTYLNDVVIVLIGGGDILYRNKLIQMIRSQDVNDKVFILDPVDPDEVHPILCGADIGLMTTENICLSYYYGVGNKLFHYLMAGLPVIVSDHPEKKKIILKYKVGEVIDESDPNNIAEVIQKLVDNISLRKCYSINALKAAKYLNWENESKKLLKMYSKML